MDQKKTSKKVVFLDRDGVINRDSSNYIKSWSEFIFIPGSLEAIKQLTLNGFTIIIITNQSVINRNMVSKKDLEHIHTMMKSDIRSHGGEIKEIFFCPHIPEDQCDCRKPEPGLIYQAAQKHQVDIKAAVMVGDSAKDVECARNAGCKHTVLVQTGSGTAAEKILKAKKIFPDFVARDLLHAAEWILYYTRQ